MNQMADTTSHYLSTFTSVKSKLLNFLYNLLDLLSDFRVFRQMVWEIVLREEIMIVIIEILTMI
jgi:hypothetical protein